MELDLTQSLGNIKKRAKKRFHFTKRGLLNSNYKRIVKYNFKKAKKRSLFKVRQRVKYLKISEETLFTSMVLKVSVFVGVALIILL